MIRRANNQANPKRDKEQHHKSPFALLCDHAVSRPIPPEYSRPGEENGDGPGDKHHDVQTDKVSPAGVGLVVYEVEGGETALGRDVQDLVLLDAVAECAVAYGEPESGYVREDGGEEAEEGEEGVDVR